MPHYDLVIIGSGPTGEKAAAQAAYFGKHVAIIERGSSPGGATVHTGTLPSKTLREAAVYLSGHRERQIYGVAVELDKDATLRTLLDRKGEISRAESDRMSVNLKRHGVVYYHGVASFKDAHTVLVDGETELSGDVILIASGSSPTRPAGVPFESDQIHDTDEILEISHIPESMSIIGAGVIGCEYASMFSALGTHVTLIDRSDWPLPFLDEEIAGRLIENMDAMGIEVLLNTAWESLEENEQGIEIKLSDGSTIKSEHVLFAVGRRGNTDDLNLAAAGLTADDRGLLCVDELYRTTQPHIIAAGDIIGFPGLASTSMEQGRVAVCHAFGFEYKQGVSNVLPFGIYTIPEVSAVGETEQSAREKGIDFVTGSALYKENARGMISGDTHGITKLIVESGTNKVLGVHVIGERATELVHIGQAAVVMGAPVTLFIDMVFNYPTLSESYKYAAYDALGAMDFNLMDLE